MRLGFDVESLYGSKTVHYRSIYQLTHESDVLHPNAMSIEERHMARINAGGGDPMPDGNKLLILRNSEKKELLRFQVQESDRYSCSIDEIASILYLACEDPHLVLRNKVMQLSCGLGLFGLLATLSVGMLHRKETHTLQVSESNVFPTKQDVALAQSLFPPSMQSLTLTDMEEEALQLTTDHLHHVVGPMSEAYFSAREFDWRLHPRFNRRVKPFYGGILSCNTPFEYPTAKTLARTVAFYLEPNGRFLHVAPQREVQSEEFDFLIKFLHEGYLMSSDERQFAVESHCLQPQVLGEEESLAEWKVATTNRHHYVGLLAAHHADYDGFNGEYLFPIENGKFDK